ncbi:hypothetical protein MTR_2g007710 [Medicago truncatula]|uniref:Uncharacterized protein n=1 Tax=Medicago truncatula TaxID=3880 RepID=G7IK04_MEDTR|nr:hypothetical protein MTR_2g007710 [Medicago truncatula]
MDLWWFKVARGGNNGLMDGDDDENGWILDQRQSLMFLKGLGRTKESKGISKKRSLKHLKKIASEVKDAPEVKMLLKTKCT